jgi:hypothetical protein
MRRPLIGEAWETMHRVSACFGMRGCVCTLDPYQRRKGFHRSARTRRAPGHPNAGYQASPMRECVTALLVTLAQTPAPGNAQALSTY